MKQNDEFRQATIDEIIDTPGLLASKSRQDFPRFLLSEGFQKTFLIDEKLNLLNRIKVFEDFETSLELNEGILTFRDLGLFKFAGETIRFDIHFYDFETGQILWMPEYRCHKKLVIMLSHEG